MYQTFFFGFKELLCIAVVGLLLLALHLKKCRISSHVQLIISSVPLAPFLPTHQLSIPNSHIVSSRPRLFHHFAVISFLTHHDG
ncbi:hypothetical protein GYMLUDRAFT_944436 [Collybiopsis luxurians FD-317 M1]|uniref:Uncharacterized protein n=1 Tax=Collybiopsis luxurians FD-317 M1 TaxID=944289 RepID=A0A0D0ARR2_9AGAR|nr:hypothetical protein GYMLUDRAFT_944436 [Collybiopsis luxurians FD-317 M1]